MTSRLPFRMVDLGAAGVDPDPEQWRGGTDYSHYSRAFEDVLLPEAPWIDEAALADARDGLRDFAEHVLAQGYNAVTVPGFLEYVTFAEVPEVYADDPEYVARAEAVRDAFGPLWAELDELGLDVYLRTDMLVLSTPLERYLTERFDLDPTDPGLWDVYEAALDELYARAPAAVRCRAPHRRGRVDLQHPGHRLLLRDHGDHGARRPGDARRLHRSGGARRQGRRLPDVERRRRCGG